ncbi:glycosyltransferase [uncultured Bartonella sp.]|uniref:glycosyltransferase n=1 Tax=uncultured Bartonella sp. TaxID=104108 RepID=UPI0025F12CD8|nr:glycosyltransferase [uncultured Bartonella sp.]
MAPSISIIIPVYNVAPWLRECLDSVVSQSFTDLEIIIVDDGSTDESSQIISDYASRDKRIIAIHKKNGGLGAARNTAISLATGNYIAFLDSDDKIHRDAYKKLYEQAKKYDCDIVFCQTAYLDDESGKISEENNQTALPLFEKFRETDNPFSLEEIDPEKIFSYDSFVVAWNKITKRSLIKKINARFPERLIFEDMPFYFNTLLNSQTLSVVWERLIFYRINRKNSIMNGNSRQGEIVEILQIIARELQATKVRTGCDYKNALSPFAYQELCYKFQQINKHKLGRKVLDQILTADDRKRFEHEVLHKLSFVSKFLSKIYKPRK